jgi:hypothetical protein
VHVEQAWGGGEDPAHVPITRRVFNHTSLCMAERHYNQARTSEAGLVGSAARRGSPRRSRP